MLAKYLLLSGILVLSTAYDLCSQEVVDLNNNLKTIQASAYRCLTTSKVDSALIYTNQLLDIGKSDSISTYVKAKQYSYAAYINEQLGNPANSYAYADTASQLYIQIDSINVDLANSLWTKGTSLLRLGDYLRAKNNLEHALRIATPINYYVSGIQNDLADCYYLMGELSKSKQLYEKLLENPEQLSPVLNLIINANLTDIYLNENEIQKAKTSWVPVDAIIGEGHLDESPLLAEFLKIKANLFRAENDYTQAFQAIEDAISSHLANNPQNLRDLVKLYCQKTELALLLEDFKTASKTIGTAVDIVSNNAKDFSHDPYNMVVHHLKAKVSRNYKIDLDSTLFHCKMAQQISDKIRLNMLHQRSKLGLAEYLEGNISLGLDVVYDSFEDNKLANNFEDAFFFLDKSRNQILLDEMAERVWSQQNALSIIDEIKQLELIQKQLLNSDKINQVGLELESAKQKLRDQFGQTYAGLASEKDYDKLEQYTTENELCLLMFGSGEYHTYVLMIQEGSSQFSKLEINNDELENLITVHNNALGNPNADPATYMQSAYNLYKAIFSDLDIQQQRVCIIPNTILNDLSFASLVVDDDSSESYKTLSYFSDHYVLQYALSSFFLSNEIDTKGDLLAIVDRESAYGNLDNHYKMLHENLSSTGADICESIDEKLLDEKLKKSSLLHISSHGFFDNDDAMESHIILPSNEDFRYHLKDIYKLSFNANPLVILNSCETGKGHELKGEGSNNFTRAFTYAGASGVIESAWKINAFSTAEIFNHFYKYLKSGDTSTDALSKSLEAFRKQSNIDNSFFHPYYWSGFKHYGNERRIETGNPLLNLGGAFIGILAIAFLWFIFRKKG